MQIITQQSCIFISNLIKLLPCFGILGIDRESVSYVLTLVLESIIYCLLNIAKLGHGTDYFALIINLWSQRHLYYDHFALHLAISSSSYGTIQSHMVIVLIFMALTSLLILFFLICFLFCLKQLLWTRLLVISLRTRLMVSFRFCSKVCEEYYVWISLGSVLLKMNVYLIFCFVLVFGENTVWSIGFWT